MPARSGPTAPPASAAHRGLNENLARECLELHTVSPAAGYTQADVTNFAKVLTGWSIDLRAEPPGFRFRPIAHEPGAQLVMGRAFPDGEEGGEAALHFLANHPATHRFLATKLVRHFVADEPPPDAVRRIEGVLRDTGGDLGAAAAALISLDAAWQPAAKLRPPLDYRDRLHCARSTCRRSSGPSSMCRACLAGLGQPLWNAPQPNGWPDRASDWATPEANDAADRLGLWRVRTASPRRGTGVTRRNWPRPPSGRCSAMDTLQAVHRAGSRREAMTLLLSAPEFQRR